MVGPLESAANLQEWAGLPELHSQLAEVVRGLGLAHDAPILDLGCGTGAWLDRLGRLGFSNLTGIDADTSHFATDAAYCLKYDLESGVPSLPRAPFQLITAIELIEHVANTGLFVHSIASALASGGRVLLATPNVHALAARLRFAISGKLPHFDEKAEPNHVSPIELTAFARVLQREGLEIVRVWSLPDRGAGKVFRPAIRMVTTVARLLLPDPLPGQELCLLVRKTTRRCPACS